MEFKEFSEFTNPETENYDINMSYKDNNYYHEQLIELIGLLEDVEEEDLLEQYGITMQEYLNPNAEVIEKVENHLSNRRSR